MKKHQKNIITIVIVGIFILTGIFMYSIYVKNKLSEIAITYVKHKYGIDTTFVSMEDVHKLPVTKWSKDILLISKDKSNTDIRVRVNIDGTVYTDDYYFFLLESMLKDQFGKKIGELWEEKGTLAVHIPTVNETVSALGGDYNHPMNSDLGLGNPELIKIMDENFEKMDIAKLKNHLPSYYIEVTVCTENNELEYNKEYHKIYELVKFLRDEHFLPEFIYISYLCGNNCIDNISIDNIENIGSVDDIENIFNQGQQDRELSKTGDG